MRRDPAAVDTNKVDSSSALKTRTPILPADVKTLAPEYMVPVAASNEIGMANGRKRRTQNSESNSGPASAKDSLPMEQRLSALNLDKTVDAVAPPQADNLAQLLLQVINTFSLLNSSFELIFRVFFTIRDYTAEIPKFCRVYWIEVTFKL